MHTRDLTHGSAALGRALTGGLLMGALMKAGQRVGLKFEENGPLGKIIVEADSEGSVRGFAGVPDAEAPVKDGKLNGYLTGVDPHGFRS